MQNAWDTDPFGDPMLQGGSPWTNPAAAGAPGGGDPAQPSAVPTPAPDTAWGADTSSFMGGTPQTPAPNPERPAGDIYDAHLTSIAQAGDPASHATAQDSLARQLQADLEADGHTVKWLDGTSLSVDGRSYELGDGGGQEVTDPTAHSASPATNPIPTNPDGSQIGSGIPWNPGEDHPNSNPPGYIWDGSKGMFVPAPVGQAVGGDSGGRMDDNAVLAQIAQWAQMPGADPTLASNPQYWLNAIQSRDGLGPFNLQYWQDASVGPKAFFRNPGRESGGAAGGAGQTSPWLSTTQPKTTSTYPAWSPSAPTYTPNAIDASASELPGFHDILDLLNTPGAGDAELQKLVQSIVEHPETLTDHDIEMLKARSAEEAAVAGQSQDEELKHFGYNTGLDTSPWLAGQRAQNAWNRSNSTITGNRNIDIAAAGTRQADRQQAASIGTAYSSFQSSKKAQAVGLAVQAALGKAGEQRSRTQLNESLKQAATQLGLTKDNLVMTYLSHAMTDATNNKQLDLNFDVDMKKLAQQSDEFKQTLLQRMHELAQADDQFKANYGLAAQEFQHRKDQDAWDRAKSTVP